MSTLVATLDLRGPLARAAQIGASFIGKAINGPSVRTLRDEIAARSFQALPDQIGSYGVREEAELLEISVEDLNSYPAVAQLRARLIQLVHAHGVGISGLQEWQPNDIAASGHIV